MAACAEIDVSLEEVERTKERCDWFRERYHQATAALTENVFAVLYRAAMKGNFAAIKFWLEHHTAGEFHRNSESPGVADPLEQMTDNELIELAKSQGLNCSD